jgi:hypothetical protein
MTARESDTHLGLEREQCQTQKYTQSNEPTAKSSTIKLKQDNHANTHNACITMTLSKNATTTPSVNASMRVKVDSKTKFNGWLWRFQ